MRKIQAQSIRKQITQALKAKGLNFSKREYRRAKRFFNTLPRTERHKFNVA